MGLDGEDPDILKLFPDVSQLYCVDHGILRENNRSAIGTLLILTLSVAGFYWAHLYHPQPFWVHEIEDVLQCTSGGNHGQLPTSPSTAR